MYDPIKRRERYLKKSEELKKKRKEYYYNNIEKERESARQRMQKLREKNLKKSCKFT